MMTIVGLPSRLCVRVTGKGHALNVAHGGSLQRL